MTERVTATTKPYTIGRPPFRPGEDADFGGKLLNSPVTLIDLTQSHAQLKIRLLTHPV